MTRPKWLVRLAVLLAIPGIVTVAFGLYLAVRFLPDEPVVYPDAVEHFKYGSTGGERESGFPFRVWQVLPKVCGLEGGYASLGLVFEEGKELPIGMSRRRNLGIDRVFLNCAACHASTVRAAPDAKPRIYLAMPAHRFDVRAFEEFFFDCAANPNFRAEYIVPAMDEHGKLGLLDRYVVYPVAIGLMRERLLDLAGRFRFVKRDPQVWGPGRVDTFNSAKVLFNMRVEDLDESERSAASDFPAIWNQDRKRGMQLHWDGNNTVVEERNKSAAFGTGTTPPTLDTKAIGRVEKWLETLRPPPYPFGIDQALAARGAPIYREYCAGCHGASGKDFSGEKVGKVTPIDLVGTDRHRLDSYTYTLAVNQSTLYAGYAWRFANFRKTFGYANMPLDGIWLRAPYLHNGSVPTLRHLLEPASARPALFYRGNDVYDRRNLGFTWDAPEIDGVKLFAYDIRTAGNSNRGHEGKAYGTQLPAPDKEALLEHLKTF